MRSNSPRNGCFGSPRTSSKNAVADATILSPGICRCDRVEQRRQFTADFCADHRQRLRLGQRPMYRAENVIEQTLMPPSATNARSVPAASGARSIDCNWVVIRRVKNVIRPDVSVAENASGKRRSVNGRDRCCACGHAASRRRKWQNRSGAAWRRRVLFEKVHLDEFAELVGDAVLIALDDRGMRDRQSQRPAEQRHHRVPIGETPDGGGFRECRDEAEGRMQVQQALGCDERRERARQHQRGQRLDAPQLGARAHRRARRTRMCRRRSWRLSERYGAIHGGRTYHRHPEVRALSCAPRRMAAGTVSRHHLRGSPKRLAAPAMSAIALTRGRRHGCFKKRRPA